MTNTVSFDWRLVAGPLSPQSASGLHWFSIPMRHPDAMVVNYVWAGAQAAVGIGGTVWLTVRRRRCGASR